MRVVRCSLHWCWNRHITPVEFLPALFTDHAIERSLNRRRDVDATAFAVPVIRLLFGRTFDFHRINSTKRSEQCDPAEPSTGFGCSRESFGTGLSFLGPLIASVRHSDGFGHECAASSDSPMTTVNPYDPPLAKNDDAVPNVAASIRPPYPWTICLLIIGGFFLLLLNGQVFTNSLVFLACVVASGAFWLRFIVRAGQIDQQRLAFYALLIHAVFMIAFATGLPAKHRWQQGFNNNVRGAQQRARTTTDKPLEQR